MPRALQIIVSIIASRSAVWWALPAACVALAIAKHELDGFWVHLDADSIDDAVVPAVDYRMPGGLSWNELSATVQAAVSSGRAVGINVTIFNPKLDEDGSITAAFVDALAEGLFGG